MSQDTPSPSRAGTRHESPSPERSTRKKKSASDDVDPTPTKRSKASTSLAITPEPREECPKCKAREQEDVFSEFPFEMRMSEQFPSRHESEARNGCPRCGDHGVPVCHSEKPRPNVNSRGRVCPKCRALEHEIGAYCDFVPVYKTTEAMQARNVQPRNYPPRPPLFEWEVTSPKPKTTCPKCVALATDLWHDHRVTGVFPPTPGPFSPTSRQWNASSPDYIPFSFDAKNRRQKGNAECSRCPVELRHLLGSECSCNKQLGGRTALAPSKDSPQKPSFNEGPPYVPFQIGSDEIAKEGASKCRGLRKHTYDVPASGIPSSTKSNPECPKCAAEMSQVHTGICLSGDLETFTHHQQQVRPPKPTCDHGRHFHFRFGADDEQVVPQRSGGLQCDCPSRGYEGEIRDPSHLRSISDGWLRCSQRGVSCPLCHNPYCY